MNREVLERQFEEHQLKTKVGTFGNMVSYIKGGAIIARLNEAFDGNWSFDVIEHKILEDEIIVLGKLTAEGISKTQFGNSRITRNRDNGEIVSIGDDLKAAATDSLKKCATLLGVGLYLYGGNGDNHNGGTKPKPEKHSDNGKGNGNGNDKQSNANSDHHNSQNGNGNGSNGRLTNKQLSAIYAIGKSKNLSQKDIKDFTVEMFNKVPDFLSKEEASTVIQELQTK